MESQSNKGLLLLAVALAALCGCATLDRLAARIDMRETRMGHEGQVAYEGRLEAVQRVGDMYALQFSDGYLVDVVNAPTGLERGDTVRLYRADKGLEAHLWRD